MQSEPSANSQPRDSSLDFLDGPPKAETSIAEREFAALYVECFVTGHAGAAILAQWEKAIFWKPTPVNATIQQYAADEARRQFIRGIRGEIEKVMQARSAN
jgi:hypothetical protein